MTSHGAVIMTKMRKMTIPTMSSCTLTQGSKIEKAKVMQQPVFPASEQRDAETLNKPHFYFATAGVRLPTLEQCLTYVTKSFYFLLALEINSLSALSIVKYGEPKLGRRSMVDSVNE